MPLKGFLCEVTGEETSFADCRACAKWGGKQGCPFTAQLLTALASPGGWGVTATMLTGCLRLAAFRQQHEYYERPSAMWARLQGTAFHLLLQRAASDGEVVEQRFCRGLTGVEVCGTPDILIPARKLLLDYKRPKSLPREAKPEHVAQVNIYRWLVEPQYEVDNLELVYLGASGPRRLPAAVWPLAQTEAYVAARATILAAALAGGALPPPEPEPTYCTTCPFRAECGV